MMPAEPWATRIGVPESFVVDAVEPFGDERPGGAQYELLTESLRLFLDDFAGAVADESTAVELTCDLQSWSKRLLTHQVPERAQAFGHRVDLPGRGQVMAPSFVMTRRLPAAVEGTVTFGRYFLGGNGAVHGGAIALLFDEVLGRLADTSGRPPARTAYLNTTYRAVTPIDTRLDVRAWFESESGRKRIVRGEIWCVDALCAEAEGLFVSLVDGQG
jgi:acyl-coenzyme A thioesterase PaaI-like protein